MPRILPALAALAAAWAFTPADALAQPQTVESLSAAQAVAIAGGGGGGGSGTQTIRSVPGVIPPSFYGANPCSNSASGGGAGVGFGFSIGGQWTERECRQQEWFRFLNMAHGTGNPVAQAYACRVNADLRRAYAEGGMPCPQDRPQAAAPAAQAPASVVAPPTVAMAAARAPRPEFCGTLSNAAERRRYAAACGG